MYIKVKKSRLLSVLLVLCCVLASLAGCSKYKETKITGGKIDSVSMVGLRSINLSLTVGIDNPAGKLDVREADGVLMHFGKVIGTVSLAPMTLKARRLSEYEVQAHMELASGMKFMDILSLADPKKLEEMVVDVSFSGKTAGIKIRKTVKDVPLKKLLEKTENGKN